MTVIDPVTGEETTNPALEPEPGKTKLLCPNASGARNWPTTAFAPATYILCVPLVETCADYRWTPRSPGANRGGDAIHFGQWPRPDSDGKLGRSQIVRTNRNNFVLTAYATPTSPKPNFKVTCKRSS